MKVNIELGLTAGETVAQKVRDLTKQIATGIDPKASPMAGWLKAAAEGGNMNPAILANSPQLQAILSKATVAGMTDGAKKAIRQIGEFPDSVWASGAKRALAMGPLFPTALPPPVPVQNFTKNNLLAGILSMGAGNPYMAARSFMAAGGIGGKGGGGGGMGGFFGMAGAGAAGDFLPAAAALAAVKLAAEALRFSFQQLTEAIQRGSKLFQDAARTGRSVGQVYQLQQALGAVGISGSTADQLLLQAQYSRTGRGGGGGFMRSSSMGGSNTSMTSFEGIMLGARNRAGQLGELQQLVNLQEYAKKAWKDSAYDSLIAAQNAGKLFNISFQASELKREWNTLWESLAADLGTILIPVISGIKFGLEGLNFVWQNTQLHKFAELFGLDKDVGNFHQQAFGQGLGEHMNQWQRMGFVMQGGPNEQIVTLREIARNTKVSAQVLTTFIRGLNQNNAPAMAMAFANQP